MRAIIAWTLMMFLIVKVDLGIEFIALLGLQILASIDAELF